MIVKGKDGKNIRIDEKSDQTLAGDIRISIDDGLDVPAGIIEGGLSGSIVIPEMITDPFDITPIIEEINNMGDKKDGKGVTVTGALAFPEDIVNGKDIITDFGTYIDVIDKSKYQDSVKLKTLKELLGDNYVWNEEYLANQSITDKEKYDDVKEVIAKNLNKVRQIAVDYEKMIKEEDEKGISL
jgi:hypothetical protein